MLWNRVLAVCAFAVASACGGIVADPKDGAGSPKTVDGGGDGAVPPSGGDDAIAPPPPIDAGDPPIAVDADDRPVTASIVDACEPGTASRPEAFVSYQYTREHAPGCGGASTCVTSFELRADCRVSGRHLGVPYGFVLSPADCLVAKRWTTSTRLLSGMRDETICSASAAKWNPDMIETDVTDGASNRKLDPSCDASPFRENRVCVNALLVAYAPGPTMNP